MITIRTNKINTFNQNSYNKLIYCIQFNCITCSCGHSATLIKHGYYNRYLKVSAGIKERLSILRVKCSFCGKTHAVLPDIIVPYSQVSINDQIIIIDNSINRKSQNEVMNNNPLIDESNISYILRNFRKVWSQKLLSHKISVNINTGELINRCFKSFSRQFMQIKYTVNILFTPTHIT